ncbi:MAG: D-amino-acid transaminase [Bacillota bacterium]
MPEIFFLNGEYVQSDQARIPVEDRGYIFGDGIYEVVRVYPKTGPFLMKEHMERLAFSAKGIRLELPMSLEKIEEACLETMRRNEVTDGTIYLQITRGVAPRTHAFPLNAKPSILIFSRPYKGNLVELRAKGTSAITTTDDRWLHCNWKTLNLIPNCLAKQAAKEAGAFEAIFIRPDGTVTEGSSSNCFVITGGVIITHPADNYILRGISRDFVMKLAQERGLKVKEEKYPEEVLRTADEIFMTGTTTEVMPIIQLDGKPVGNGKIGPVTKTLMTAFDEAIGRK